MHACTCTCNLTSFGLLEILNNNLLCRHVGKLRNNECVTGSETDAVFISDPPGSVGRQFTEGHASLMIPVLAQQRPSSSLMLVENVPEGRFQEPKAKGGSLDAAASLIELLDGLVLFYHLSAHKQLAKVWFTGYIAPCVAT